MSDPLANLIDRVSRLNVENFELKAHNERLRKAFAPIIDGIEECNSMPCTLAQFKEAKAALEDGKK